MYLFCCCGYFVKLFGVVKEQTVPFLTYYGYCHSLDGATLFSKVDSNKLRFNVRNKMTLVCAKFDADLSLSIVLKLQAVKQSGPAFLAYPVVASRLRRE